MNIMRKILSHHGAGGGQEHGQERTDQDLSIMHLNKLFNEVKHNNNQFISSSSGSCLVPSKYDKEAQKALAEYEHSIYKLLPLFLKVFGSSNGSTIHSHTSGSSIASNDMFDKFNDLTLFTQIVARLMVTEIRRRASNKTTEDASQCIVRFLEIPREACPDSTATTPSDTKLPPSSSSISTSSTESNQRGWILLSTLNLLVCGGSAPLIPIMASTSLPSTLVKCLYLFFDLPSQSNDPSSTPTSPFDSIDRKMSSSDQELSDKERRLLLQRVFAQLLTRLCSHQSSLNELTRKDDLALIFNAVTSWCPNHNKIWRHTAADVILTMAKFNVITAMNASYIHEKNCINVCVENLSRMAELSTTKTSEITEMLATLINFLSEITLNTPSIATVLLEDFKSSLGYHFLVDFTLKLESRLKEDYQCMLRVISLVAQFTKVGCSDLKPRPLSVNQLFIMDDFSMPRPTPKQAIRNLSSFNVLQTLWVKSKTAQLQELILIALLNLCKDDRANYFILDSQNTLSQFAQEKLQFRAPEIQEKYFSILEFVIYELKYVPCKELISISNIIKSKHSMISSIICLKTLLSIVKFNIIFRDVYREVGLLDIIASLVVNRSQQYLSEPNIEVKEDEQTFLELILEITSQMLTGPNNQNCTLFNDAGAAKHVFNFLPQKDSKVSKKIRKQAFVIIQQLILSNSGEEHLASLLTLMHNPSEGSTVELTLQQELSLKTSVLKSLLSVLRESHRCRALFRKVGGFVYVMSVLIGMEGCLADQISFDNDNMDEDLKNVNPKSTAALQWTKIEKKKIWNLLKSVFATLTTAMRFEPANARFFANEICPASLTDSIRLLGCFNQKIFLEECGQQNQHNLNNTQTNNFNLFFKCSLDELPPKLKMNSIESATLVMRLLYDMTLDDIDKHHHSASFGWHPTNNQSKHIENAPKDSFDHPKRPPNLVLTPTGSSGDPPIIIHSCIVIVMLHLIPSISDEPLRCFIGETLRLLLKSERNQQVMCEANLITEILSDKFNVALVNENHPLHPAVQYMLERLAAHFIQPKELRCFLRLGNPLNCIAFDDLHKNKILNRPANQKDGCPIPLSRIKTLVSMTTPKDTSDVNLLQPPFVEFDMNQEGFSCLFLPSIAPLSTGSGGNSGNILAGAIGDGNKLGSNGVNGGIGIGERTFPPQGGITFLTWICVEKFSSQNEDIHNTRLLTILRGSNTGQEYACLQIQIAARDRALLISTQETPIFGDGDLLQPPCPISMDSDHNLRIWNPESLSLQQGQWHHIAVVLNRALLKNSTTTVYIDGNVITSQKLHYISSVVGGSTGISNANALYVNGFIGTPPNWRKQSKNLWKQGPCHLIEEPLTSNLISKIYGLGPNYIGSFQGCFNSITTLVGIASQQPSQQAISEDKIIFGLNARATSIMTLAKMRRVYTRFDCRQISKILGLSSHENATPIYVLHNSSGHLLGPSRSLGAILIGYIGARCYVPKPVSVTCQDVGGCVLLLGLVANSQDVESLYASIKALVCVLKSNKELVIEMERINGYQTLAMLLRRKKQFLNSHVLHLTFNLVGTLDVYRKNEYPCQEIQQPKAFKDLLVDQIDLWTTNTQNELLRSLLEHINELLINESSSQQQSQYIELKSKNIKILRELGLLPRLLQLLWDIKISEPKIMQLIKTLIYTLLNKTPRQYDLLYFGQFLAALLPTCEAEKSDDIIDLRNSLLKIVLQLLTRNSSQEINYAIHEELVRILGFDWFLLFIQGSLQRDTVTIGLVNIMVLLSNPNILPRFREGTNNGGWLKDTENIFSNRFGVQLLGFNVGGPPSTPGPHSPGPSAAVLLTAKSETVRMIRHDLFTLPGFQHLSYLMSYHVQQPQVYLVLFQGLLGQYVQLTVSVLDAVESFHHLNLDNLWNCLFGENKRSTQSNTSVLACSDISIIILDMVHNLIWDVDNSENISSYPVTLIQFLMYLYHNRKDFQTYCHTNVDFICGLTKTITREEEKESSISVLTTHSAKKYIMDFIRLITIDSLTAVGGFQLSKIGIFELFLEFFSNCKLAQTELIYSLMEHLTSLIEVMAQQQQFDFGITQQQQQSQQQATTNTVLFASIITDKLWQDCYLRDPKEILDFQLKLLVRLNLNATPPQQQKSAKNSNGFYNELTLLYKSLNRIILYLVSRPLETISDRMAMLEVLQKIHGARQLILISSCNNDPEFFVCLTYCLLQLIDEARISLTGKTRTTWHVYGSEGRNEMNEVADEGALLIASVARKVWDEIYLSKKSQLEEAIKINLVPSTPPFGLTSVTPDLSQLRDTLYEPTLRIWVNFIETEQQKQRRERLRFIGSAGSLDSPSVSSPTTNLFSEKFGNINKFTTKLGGGAGGLVSKIVGGTGAVTGAIGANFLSSSSMGNPKNRESLKSSIEANLVKTSLPQWNIMTKKEVDQWTLTHISIINDLVELQLKQRYQSDSHLQKYVFDDWLIAEYEFLIRERAIFGPDFGSRQFDKWKLDMTEGPHRMRKKLVRNENFYACYPYRTEYDSSDLKTLKYKLPISFDSKEFSRRFRAERHNLIERDLTIDCDSGDEHAITSVNNISQDKDNCYEPKYDTMKRIPSKSPSTEENIEGNDDVPGFVDIGSEVSGPGNEIQTDNNNSDQIETQTLLRLLEEGEKISHMFRCARVEGLDTFEGLLLFGREYFYLIDGFTLLKTREIKDIDSLPANMHDPIIPTTSPSGSFSSSSVKRTPIKKLCMKFAYEDIKEVHKRRYLLQPIALEVFSMDGRNSLLVFPRKLRNKAYSRFMSVATHITDNTDSLAGQKRNVNVESGTSIFSTLIGELSVTQRWSRGEISNFQYLMHLNTLAGRSYNDLMQYPIFPWILADYTSQDLDFNNPNTFRDLGKPMGAQTPDRLDQFRKRFGEWDDPHLDTPPYHYGTFYSSAMIVASYLVRMEPFTQHFLRLQGGHFDLADRMFHSVGDSWLSAAKNNMADVKELIPEFFYLPEFLDNSNKYDLGVKQNGIRLDYVILPPWAKGDSREFIRVHRAALECDYVSSHLHEWIDLIFGYKQQGVHAVEAVNVFHHLFYEGNVDIYTIEDPLKKNATIGFINNFGQIPKQLFKKPHPSKKINSSSLSVTSSGLTLTPLKPVVGLNSVLLNSSSQLDKIFIHNLDILRPTMHPVKELRGAVGQIIHQEKTNGILAVEQNKVLIPPQYNRYVAWGFADHSLRIGPYESERALHIFESDILPPSGEILSCTVPNSRLIITAGTSSVISAWRIRGKNQKLQLIQNLYGHTEGITCLTSSASYGIIVSGSRDKTCIIWDLNRLIFVRQLGATASFGLAHPAPISAITINDLSGDIATCASNWLFVWSINGDPIASVNTLSISGPNTAQSFANANSTQILCAAFSTYNEWDSNNVIMTGSTDGVVRMFCCQYNQVPIQEENAGNTPTSISSASSSPVTEDATLRESAHLAAPLSKDEIVRRMSLASVKSKEGEDANDTSEESSSELEENKQNDNEWVNIEHDGNTITTIVTTADDGTVVEDPEASSSSIPHSKSTTSEFFILTPPESNQNKRKSNASMKSQMTLNLEVPKLRSSKSDTSLIDSFIVVTGGEYKKGFELRPGHKWKLELIYKSKLTMHTAFERKDNKEPASITALAISKDSKTVFVGDARGRIFSWSVGSESNRGGIQDHWVKDDLADVCTNCATKFTFSERKHHCRNCGFVFCSKCSKYEIEIFHLKMYKPVRVCQTCYTNLLHQQEKQKTAR